MDGWYGEITPVLVETGRRIVFGREQWLVPCDCMAMSKEIAGLGDPKMIVSGVEIGWNNILAPSFLLPVACLSVSRECPQPSLFAMEPDPYCLMGFRVTGFRFWGNSFENAIASLAARLKDDRGVIVWDSEVDAFGDWLVEQGFDAAVMDKESEDCGCDLSSVASDAVDEIREMDVSDAWFRERVVVAVGGKGFDRRTASLTAAACVAYSSPGILDRLAVSLFLADPQFMEARIRHLLGRAQTWGIQGDPAAFNATTVLRETLAIASDAASLSNELWALSSAFRGKPNLRAHLRLVK